MDGYHNHEFELELALQIWTDGEWLFSAAAGIGYILQKRLKPDPVIV